MAASSHGDGEEEEGELLVVRAHQGFGYHGGEGGGGGSEGNSGIRVLSNLALVVGLTYLTLSGQLGWVFDAIACIWLLAVLLPVVGLGTFFWVAGRDLVQDSRHPAMTNVAPRQSHRSAVGHHHQRQYSSEQIPFDSLSSSGKWLHSSATSQQVEYLRMIRSMQRGMNGEFFVEYIPLEY